MPARQLLDWIGNGYVLRYSRPEATTRPRIGLRWPPKRGIEPSAVDGRKVVREVANELIQSGLIRKLPDTRTNNIIGSNELGLVVGGADFWVCFT